MINISSIIVDTESQEPMNIRLVDNSHAAYSISTRPPFSTTSAQQFEVTTDPSGAANVRARIYQADNENQPTGALLYEPGSIAIAIGFTGLKITY